MLQSHFFKKSELLSRRFSTVFRWTLSLIAVGCLPAALFSQTKIKLVDFASGYVRPVDIENCGDDRLFVVEQDGKIWILDSTGKISTEPFLDIDARVKSTGNEQGLLGLAFHPNYKMNGFFFVYYTDNTAVGNTQVSRFSVLPDNPQKADPASEVKLLGETQPYSNHNGGCIKFGPDGYLYIGLGDGGSGGDPQGNGQKTNTFLAKMLRIDVNGTSSGNYSVPPSNPFVGNPAYKPEIWSLGWRNPWRFSFDRVTGDLWVGDVGQNKREEIDFEPKNTPGRNYGWRCYEGTQTYNTTGCQGAGAYQKPVFDYANPSVGCSVTGGFVYRGARYPSFYGLYLHTDYCSGLWWATRRNADSTFTTWQLANLSDNDYSSLGEDYLGELYVAGLASGKIYKIRELCGNFKMAGTASAAVCDSSFAGTIFLDLAGGLAPYKYAWSNGKTDKDIVYLNPGMYSVIATDANGCELRDTFVIERANPAPPVLSPDGTVLTCPGKSVLLQAQAVLLPDYQYQWRDGSQLIAGASDSMLLVTGDGVFQVRLVGLACNSTWSNAVTLQNLADITPTISAFGNFNICGVDTLTLSALFSAPIGIAYQWYTAQIPIQGATTELLRVSDPGTYQVEYVSGECKSALKKVEVTQSLPPIINILGAGLLSIQGTYTNIQWLTGNNVDWTPAPGNANSNSYQAGGEGFFTVRVTDSLGCTLQAEPVAIGETTLPASVRHFSLTPNPTSDVLTLSLELETVENIAISMADGAGRTLFLQTKQEKMTSLPIDLRALPGGTYFLMVQMESGRFVRHVVKL